MPYPKKIYLPVKEKYLTHVRELVDSLHDGSASVRTGNLRLTIDIQNGRPKRVQATMTLIEFEGKDFNGSECNERERGTGSV
jgi:hypothetical protein